MQDVNKELKKLVGTLKSARTQFQTAVKSGTLVGGVKKYAERQGREAKKLINPEITKVKAFVEKEKKEWEKIQKKLPNEVQKLRKFVDEQRKELEKLLVSIRDGKATTAVKATVKKRVKKATSKKSGSTTSAS